MTFHKIHNDMLNTGVADGQLPLIGTGNKLATALLDVGEAADQIVQLDGSGKLPAIDGSLLTNIPVPSGGIGSMVLLDTQIISTPVAQIEFTSGIDATYDYYRIIATDIRASVSFSPAIQFYLGGLLITSADYDTPRTKLNSNDANNSYYSNNDRNLSSSVISPTSFNSISGSPFNNVIIDIPKPTAVGAYKLTRNQCFIVSDNAALTFVESATVCKANASDLTGIRFYPFSGGNLTRGTFKLYGIS